jgi:hypothetical protein
VKKEKRRYEKIDKKNRRRRGETSMNVGGALILTNLLGTNALPRYYGSGNIGCPLGTKRGV